MRDFLSFFAFCKGKISYNTLFKYHRTNISQIQKNTNLAHIVQGTVQRDKWKEYNEKMIKKWGNKDTNHIYNYCFDYTCYYLRKGTRKIPNCNNRFKEKELLDILPLVNIGYEEMEFWITEVLNIPTMQQEKKLKELKCMSNVCELETHCDMIQHLNDYKLPMYVKIVIYIHISFESQLYISVGNHFKIRGKVHLTQALQKEDKIAPDWKQNRKYVNIPAIQVNI